MTQEDDQMARMTRALLMSAPSHQGGHSEVGMVIAEALAIPFPIDMENLSRRAGEMGYQPYDLWPWLKKLRDRERATT